MKLYLTLVFENTVFSNDLANYSFLFIMPFNIIIEQLAAFTNSIIFSILILLSSISSFIRNYNHNAKCSIVWNLTYINTSFLSNIIFC